MLAAAFLDCSDGVWTEEGTKGGGGGGGGVGDGSSTDVNDGT